MSAQGSNNGSAIRRMSPENAEINLMYLMSYAIWFLADDVERRLAGAGERLRFHQRQAFNNMIKHLKGAKCQHDILFQDYVVAWNNEVKNYDMEQRNANTLARLALLFYDRVLGYEAREECVEDMLLRDFPEEDISAEVLQRFHMKTLAPKLDKTK